MTEDGNERVQAAKLSPENAIGVLLEQHSQIRELLAAVGDAGDADRQQAFDELRWFLALHEAGEEVILRPVAREAVGMAATSERNDEESEAAGSITLLEGLDVGSEEFATGFAELRQAVLQHAENEEQLEFPLVLENRREEDLTRWGAQLVAGAAGLTPRAVPVDEDEAEAEAVHARAVVEVDPGVEFEAGHESPSPKRSAGSIGPYTDLLDRAREAYRSA